MKAYSESSATAFFSFRHDTGQLFSGSFAYILVGRKDTVYGIEHTGQ